MPVGGDGIWRMTMRRLLVRGVLYRLHNMMAHAVILLAITGRWDVSLGTSVLLNFLNVLLYYHFHFWAERIEKRWDE